MDNTQTKRDKYFSLFYIIRLYYVLSQMLTRRHMLSRITKTVKKKIGIRLVLLLSVKPKIEIPNLEFFFHIFTID